MEEEPNRPVSELENNWVGDTCVVYIGKAGGVDASGKKSKSTLRKRINAYLEFEKELISEFKQQYGDKLPFANLKD